MSRTLPTRVVASVLIFALLYSPVLGGVSGTVAAAQAVQNTTTSYVYDTKDAHDMKQDLGLDSKSDIFSDTKGNMYSGPRKGTGLPQYLHMNTGGW
jgi:hypothetical protein